MAMKLVYKLVHLFSLCLVLGVVSCSQDIVLEEVNSTETSQLRDAAIEYVPIVLKQAGTLESELGDRKTTIESLKLTGLFNAADVRCIRSMPALKNLDMKDVKIESSKETYDAGWGDDLLIEDKMSNHIFAKLKNLVSIILPNNIIEIGEYAFGETALESIAIPNSVQNIQPNAFRSCYELKSCILPSSIRRIQEGLFLNCSNLASISIPDGVNSIEPNAFGGCKELTSIIIPSSVTSIGDYAFMNCAKLATIPLPEGVATLGGGVFDNCSSLTTLTLPVSIKRIGDITRGTLPNLTSVYWKTAVGNTLPELDIPANCLIYAYTDAPFHKTWTNIIRNGVANEITLVDGQAFNCPEAFTTKKISFTKSFSLTTGYGESAGWETIVLPFTVQKIVDETNKKMLTPFKSSNKTEYNFWLRTLGSSRFEEVPELQANKPYLIAMPNNSVYDPKYCIKGNVLFSAENAKIEKTPEEVRLEGTDFSMLPAYRALDKKSTLYVLNKRGDDRGMKRGAAFFSSQSDIKPLEAFLMDKGTNLRCIMIPPTDGIRTKSSVMRGASGMKPSINDL